MRVWGRVGARGSRPVARTCVRAALVGLLGVVLAGCSVGSLQLPDLSFDLPDLGSFELPSLGQDLPSVAEARAARTAELNPKVSGSALHEQGVLTVGVLGSSTSAPFCIQGSDGTLSGMDVDVACALADELGLTVRFQAATSASAALSSGCDVVMGVKAADATAVLAGSYAQTACGLFSRASAEAPSVSDLSEASVGVQTSSASARTLADLGLVTNQHDYANLNEAFDALEKGEVDYVVCEASAGAYLAGAYEDVALVGTLDQPISVGVATEASNTTLADAVSSAFTAMDSNGVLDVARSRWVGDLPLLTTANEVEGLEAASAEIATGDASSDDVDSTPDAASTPDEIGRAHV